MATSITMVFIPQIGSEAAKFLCAAEQLILFLEHAMERVKNLTVLLFMSLYGSRQPSQSRLGLFLSRATCVAKQ
jgi:hypothetical protein